MASACGEEKEMANYIGRGQTLSTLALAKKFRSYSEDE